MKALLVFFCSMVLVAQSQASTALLKYDFIPGYTIHRVYISVFVYDDGQVIQHSRDAENKKLQVETLAQLSDYSLTNIKAKISQVTLNDVLVDEDANGPRCTDTPTISVSIVRNTSDQVIYRNGECHTEQTENYYANQLVTVVMGLADLGK